MTTLITILLLAGANTGEGYGFQAQLQYTPSLLTRGDNYGDDPLINALFNPLGAFYFSNSLSGKVGIEALEGWNIRIIGGVSKSNIKNGNLNIHFLDGLWYTSPGNAFWKSREVSFGGEVGHAVRFNGGKGDIYLGLEGVLNELSGQGTYACDTGGQTDFTVISHGKGLQGHIGARLPVLTSGRFSLGLDAQIRGGFIPQTPDSIPDGSVWVDASLPRWGCGLGLNLAYDGNKKLNIEEITDLRLRPNVRDTIVSKPRSSCLTKRWMPPWIVQGAGSLLGSQIGNAAYYWALSLLWLGDGEPDGLMALSNYVGVPVGATLGTLLASRWVRPGGDWRYATLGAFAGDVLSFGIAQAYLLINGTSWWRRTPDGGPPTGGYNSFYTVVLPLCSTLPAVGSVVGYNLSFNQACPSEEDMGYNPTWSQIALGSVTEEWNSSCSNERNMGFTLLKVNF